MTIFKVFKAYQDMFTSNVELLPAKVLHNKEELFLRIKKVDGNKRKTWRIRYISVNSGKILPTKPKKMNYFKWKDKHHLYRTRLRSEGASLEKAAAKMLEHLDQLQKGERKLSDH